MTSTPTVAPPPCARASAKRTWTDSSTNPAPVNEPPKNEPHCAGHERDRVVWKSGASAPRQAYKIKAGFSPWGSAVCVPVSKRCTSRGRFWRGFLTTVAADISAIARKPLMPMRLPRYHFLPLFHRCSFRNTFCESTMCSFRNISSV